MTTIAQLVKQAKIKFIPEMEKLAFFHHGKLCFSIKDPEDIYKVILSDLSYGENLKFHVTCIVKDNAPNKMENFRAILISQ